MLESLTLFLVVSHASINHTLTVPQNKPRAPVAIITKAPLINRREKCLDKVLAYLFLNAKPKSKQRRARVK